MKTNYSPLFLCFFLILTACGSKTDKFTGTWQDAAEEINSLTITNAGKNFILEFNSPEMPAKRMTAAYNADKDILEFATEDGTTFELAYDQATGSLISAGKEFVKRPVSEASHEENKTEDVSAAEAVSEPVGQLTSGSKCGKGTSVFITGDNVRLRAEPDLTKNNVILLLRKGAETTHINNKADQNPEWVKVCFDGQVGWVSKQYARMM